MEWLLREAWTTVHSLTVVMTRKEVIEAIKKEIGPECDDKMAEFIFRKSIESEDIIVKLDWVYIINRIIIAAVIVAAIWALLQYV